MLTGQVMQLIIDQGEQLVECFTIAARQLLKQVVDCAGL
jgi:hypothetical protein